MHRIICSTMHHLQKLNSELDVSEPARAEFDLSINFVGRNEIGDALSHLLN